VARPRARDDVFKAIADRSRRRLLDLLLERDMAVQDLVERFDISFPAISQHLGVLLQARLVTCRSVGRHRVYSARPRALRSVHQWTAKYEKFWAGRRRRLGEHLDAQSPRRPPP
jgi:DNA-binding transcriptional ArsR family regulator